MTFHGARRVGTGALAALLAALAGLAAGPASAEPTHGWVERGHLTGDWGGLRTALEGRGVHPFAHGTAGVLANLDGGLATGTRYIGFAHWGLAVDLEKLAGVPDLRFHIDWISYLGGVPSQDLIGAFSTSYADNLEAEISVRFYEIYLEANLFDGRLDLKLGQLAADDDFYVSRFSSTLRNASFGYFASGRDVQIAPFYPLAGPGAYAAIEPCDPLTLQLGAYVADVGEDDGDDFGFDSRFDEGGTFFAEIDLALRLAGRASNWSLGGYVTTREVPDYESGGDAHGGFGFYAALDQVLLAKADGDPRLGAFLRGGWRPQSDRSVITWYLQSGFEWFGPVPGRPRDVFSAGLSYTDFRGSYRRSQRSAGQFVGREERIVEITYKAHLTNWLTLQPHLEVFFDPALSRDHAVALGVVFGITL